ncbi:2-C-methyl-D-erythritol 4-phosphate cytidylyltransferase [Thermoproteota archaeon]
MKIGLILAAAGDSKRFNGLSQAAQERNASKQLFIYKDTPLFIHALNAFLGVKDLLEIIITAKPESLTAMRTEIEKLDTTIPIKVIPGGATRALSVKHAFDVLSNVDRVLIHDGARPNISPKLIQDIITASSHAQAVIPVLPVTDTIKYIEQGRVVKTLDRQHLVTVQTPQAFHFDTLKQAYAQTDWEHATDEAWIVEQIRVPVHVVDGDAFNIKVTYAGDVAYLTYYALDLI